MDDFLLVDLVNSKSCLFINADDNCETNRLFSLLDDESIVND